MSVPNPATARPGQTDRYCLVGSTTHEVANQPPPLSPYDTWTTDRALMEWVRRGLDDRRSDSTDQFTDQFTANFDDGDADPVHDLANLGQRAGSVEVRQWAAQANDHPPVLHTHDRYGHRVDEVEFHPAWHELMTEGVSAGLQAAPWRVPEDQWPVQHPHLRRAAGFYLWSQAEPGHGCPLSMTYAAVPALNTDPDLAASWVPRLTATGYEPGPRPASTKGACLAGMAMTEKQGGSDVRANTTVAEPEGTGAYVLTGHKWFCSAPMSDVFLMLAQAPGGLTCFVVPRVIDDGTRNGIRLMRLKNKLGNRSNASAEIELDRAWAQRLGAEGRGVATIISMVAATRLDCVLGSAALMRRAVVEAIWHTGHRSAFGTHLIDAPTMRNVLADLAIEQEAATALAMRLATAVDEDERDLLRLGLPIAKFLVCKRTPAVVAEALECLGGNGYVEESGLPLLFRESPLNSIWEGSGNLQALDVLRALQREPAALEAWLTEVGHARGADTRLDHAIENVLESLADLSELEFRARRIAEQLARAMQGALLCRYAPAAVADAFCASRLGQDSGDTFGTLPRGTDASGIVEKAFPLGESAS